MTPAGNDSGSTRFTVFALSLRRYSFDFNATTGNKIAFFQNVITRLSVPPVLVCSDFNGTGSGAGSACRTISRGAASGHFSDGSYLLCLLVRGRMFLCL